MMSVSSWVTCVLKLSYPVGKIGITILMIIIFGNFFNVIYVGFSIIVCRILHFDGSYEISSPKFLENNHAKNHITTLVGKCAYFAK